MHSTSGANSTVATNFRDYVFSAISNTTSTVGIDEKSLFNSGLIVYPNPSSTGVFFINAEKYQKNTTSLVIADLTGRVLQSKKVNELNSNEISIETKGIYFISVIQNNSTIATQKVVVY